MAKADIKVELSDRDRRLLRDVVDAIRSLKDKPEETKSATRLVEGADDNYPDSEYVRLAQGRSVKDRVEEIQKGYGSGSYSNEGRPVLTSWNDDGEDG